MTLSTWQLLVLGQVVILLLAGNAILGWLLWRQRASETPADQDTPTSEASAAGNSDQTAPIRRFLESELARTRAQLQENDRNLPDHVLRTRINYLDAELDALRFAEQPDPYWAHLCECIDGWQTTPPPQPADDDGAPLEATHTRLQRLIADMEKEPPSQVVVRQLAVIERRLAAIQRQDEEGDIAGAPNGRTGNGGTSEELR